MYLIDASLTCNLSCAYCYSRPLREKALPTDLDKIEKTCRELYAQEKSDFCLHGGEPCSWPIETFDRLLKLSFDLTGKSSIQTNGSCITDEHIELLKKYKTSVGFSIDGPWPLNRFRGDEEATKQVLEALEHLIEEGVSTGLISVIHRANGLPDARVAMKGFIEWCNERKITGRLNPCVSDKVALTPVELKDFYCDMASWMLEKGIGCWSPFRDIVNSLLGKPDCVCVFKPCPPYRTPAGIVITAQGEVSMCHKFHKEVLLNTLVHSNTRDLVLKQTDCKGCPYFENCYGGCPSAAVDDDWRNKDRNCISWKALFGFYSNVLKSLGIQTLQASSPDIEHLDGAVRHLDSDLVKSQGHTDGIEHLDGTTRHLDSGPEGRRDLGGL